MWERIKDWFFGTVRENYQRGVLNTNMFLLSNPTDEERQKYWNDAHDSLSFADNARTRAYCKGVLSVLEPNCPVWKWPNVI